MIASRTTLLLVFLCFLCLGAVWFVRTYAVHNTERADAILMQQAADRAARWFQIVIRQKDSLGLIVHGDRRFGYRGLLGEEYSSFTTTLGSLDAKETTLNPDYAALIVRILHDAGIDSGSTVGVTLSGSFPAIGISTLAALRTTGMQAVIISSLGASSYGANQPGASWLDIERWLVAAGELQHSTMVTFGGEGDAGGGISEEGLETLRSAAERAGMIITIPRDLDTAIEERIRIFSEANITLLINIGGNQAVLGGCVHGSTHPNGFHRILPVCDDKDRGVLSEMNARGIPIFHFLNIRDLALQYSLPLGISDASSADRGVYNARRASPLPVIVSLSMIFGGLLAVWKFRRRERET